MKSRKIELFSFKNFTLLVLVGTPIDMQKQYHLCFTVRE